MKASVEARAKLEHACRQCFEGLKPLLPVIAKGLMRRLRFWLSVDKDVKGSGITK